MSSAVTGVTGYGPSWQLRDSRTSYSSPLFYDCELYSTPCFKSSKVCLMRFMIRLFVTHSPPKPLGNHITLCVSTLQSTVLRPIMTGSSDVTCFYLWFSEPWSREPSRRKFSLKQHLQQWLFEVVYTCQLV